jgi:hypothetical protein
VLYLGEINDTHELAWGRSIEVLEEGAAQPRTLWLFPEYRCAVALADASEPTEAQRTADAGQNPLEALIITHFGAAEPLQGAGSRVPASTPIRI